jgi:hypothetical protein
MMPDPVHPDMPNFNAYRENSYDIENWGTIIAVVIGFAAGAFLAWWPLFY